MDTHTTIKSMFFRATMTRTGENTIRVKRVLQYAYRPGSLPRLLPNLMLHPYYITLQNHYIIRSRGPLRKPQPSGGVLVS